jgi:hypothetical protein
MKIKINELETTTMMTMTTTNNNNNNNNNKVIPVIIGVTETISKSLRQYLSNIPGKHKIKELQKTAILGNSHILRKVLMGKCKTYFTGKITLHVAQIAKYRTAATLYTLETWFVSGI